MGFEKMNFLGKKEQPKTEEEKEKKRFGGHTFEDLLNVLPDNEARELKELKDIERSLATSESEDSLEIDHSQLTEGDEKSLERYYALIKKAENILDSEKKS